MKGQKKTLPLPPGQLSLSAVLSSSSAAIPSSSASQIPFSSCSVTPPSFAIPSSSLTRPVIGQILLPYNLPPPIAKHNSQEPAPDAPRAQRPTPYAIGWSNPQPQANLHPYYPPQLQLPPPHTQLPPPMTDMFAPPFYYPSSAFMHPPSHLYLRSLGHLILLVLNLNLIQLLMQAQLGIGTGNLWVSGP